MMGGHSPTVEGTRSTVATLMLPFMGTLQMAFVLKTLNGVLDATDGLVLENLVNELNKPGKRLCLHLHGGLVDEANGLSTATRLADSQDYVLGPQWARAFFVWRTGAGETIRSNWKDLYENDRLFNTLRRHLLEFIAGKVLVVSSGGRGVPLAVNADEQALVRRAIPEVPQQWELLLGMYSSGTDAVALAPDQSEHELMTEFQQVLSLDNLHFEPIAAELEVSRVARGRGGAAPASAVAPEFNRLTGSVQGELTAQDASGSGRFISLSAAGVLLRHAGGILVRIVRRLRSSRDHGLHATIVEEICREFYGDLVGATIWGMMKKDAADHFSENGAGLALLRALPKDSHMAVSAHSAGSIWAAELLLALGKHRQDVSVDLLLLAPAVRVDLFAEALKASGSVVKRCCIFTMSDDAERVDALLGPNLSAIYPSSLLYLVSGLFEEAGTDAMPDAPILGMQRFIGQAGVTVKETEQVSALDFVKVFLARPENAVVYSPTAPGAAAAASSSATSHGSFDADVLTLRSLTTLLR